MFASSLYAISPTAMRISPPSHKALSSPVLPRADRPSSGRSRAHRAATRVLRISGSASGVSRNGVRSRPFALHGPPPPSAEYRQKAGGSDRGHGRSATLHFQHHPVRGRIAGLLQGDAGAARQASEDLAELRRPG